MNNESTNDAAALTAGLPPRPDRRRLVLASGAATFLAACGGGGDDYPAIVAPNANAMRTTVATSAAEMLVPGAVVIVTTPKGDFRYTYGATTYHGSTAPTPDLHIRIGSCTKTMMGTVTLQHVQEGRLALRDPISKYIAGVPKGDEITIEQLLLMRSGLPNYTITTSFNQALDDNPRRVWSPTELVALAFLVEQDFDPGTSWNYSNTNTVLLGLVAEKLENGKPLSSILQDRIYKPLGLAGTSFPVPADNTLPAPYSNGYQYGTNVQTLAALPPDVQAAARAGTFLPTDETLSNPSWGWAAGAGISTANDLVTYVRALVVGGLLNPEMQALRLASIRPSVPPRAGLGYGYHIAQFGALYGHTGELPGYNTFMGHDPVNNVTVVVWVNLGPNLDAQSAGSTIAQELIGQIYRPAA